MDFTYICLIITQRNVIFYISIKASIEVISKYSSTVDSTDEF